MCIKRGSGTQLQIKRLIAMRGFWSVFRPLVTPARVWVVTGAGNCVEDLPNFAVSPKVPFERC